MAEEQKVTEAKTVEVSKETEAPSQDPIKQELDKQKKPTYSEKEKAAYNLRRQAEKLKELGEDPVTVLGLNDDKEPGDEIPEWYKKEKAKDTQNTALQLADSIEDENVRSLVKSYLQNRIIPSDNPQEDFRLAYNAVSALKNKQIAEEVSRRTGAPKITAAGSSAGVKVEGQFEPTPEEAYMMTHFKVSKEKILAAREKEQAKHR